MNSPAQVAGLRQGLARILAALASVEFTLVNLGLLMILVFFGTLAQVHLGTWQAQREFFNSVWVSAPVGEWRVPLLPGGLSVGALWIVNLTAAFVVRFRWELKSAGLLLSHFGLILLLVGQFLSQTLTRERQMPLQTGQTRDYSEDFRDSELVLLRSLDQARDEVKAIPTSLIRRQRTIDVPGTPLTLGIRRFYANARLGMAESPQASIATRGIGPQIVVQEEPVNTTDDQSDLVTAFIEVFDSGESRGVWLVSAGLGAPQEFSAGGQTWRMQFRPRRYYHPFSLTLQEFKHDRYPGTEIPKNFSSRVLLQDPERGVSRETLIYMNHPLRYRGLSFYQASFKGDDLSVFQVVENPARLWPYVSCGLMVLGLVIQFGGHWIAFSRRRRLS